MVKQPEERYWIKGGLCVRLKGGYGPRMTVMRVLEVRKQSAQGQRTVIQGVLCTYKDPFDGKDVKKRFHTQDIEPCG